MKMLISKYTQVQLIINKSAYEYLQMKDAAIWRRPRDAI